MYRAILFDLDGTLTESGEGIMKSVQYALEKIGRPENDLEKLRVFVGPPLLEQFMQYAHVDQETAGKCVEFYRERYSDVGIYENRPYPGIKKVLGKLEKCGYLLIVASSKPEYYVKKVLDHFGMTSFFHEIVGSEMDGRRTRKSEVIEEALRRTGLSEKRDEVLMVGDKEQDIQGAREAGLDCLAVSYGYGTMEELQGAKPLKIVDSTEELMDFFGGAYLS